MAALAGARERTRQNFESFGQSFYIAVSEGRVNRENTILSDCEITEEDTNFTRQTP